jgi:hypothetical protein
VRSHLALALLVALGGAGLGIAACDSGAPSPFVTGAGGEGGTSGAGAQGGEGGGVDPTLGGPCTSTEQCDDGFDCTMDTCDMEVDRCRFTPDDSQCQNDLHCDGLEICDNKLGCILGEPITCSDGNSCTIDTCNEAEDNCIQEPRDVDGDGDPDIHCGGGDCDDFDPKVSSQEYEVCGNGRDDDCDQQIDETACFLPEHDKCLDPLLVTTPGTYAMSTQAAGLDYSATCGVGNATLARDVVAAIQLAAGPPMDVQLTARTEQVDVALALAGLCGQPSSEITCSPGFEHPQLGRVAKVRGRSLGDTNMQLVFPAYVFTEGGSELTLRYELLPASSKPANETCGTASVLAPNTPTLASVVDAVKDLASACPLETGELVYQFDLATPQDIDVYGTSVDGDGNPALSLRTSACALPGDEITCNAASSAHIFRHSLAAGTYYLAVAATAPTDVIVTLVLSPPTAAPADEDCTTAPPITVNQDVDVPLASHQDDHNTGCLPGGVDAAYALDLTQASDVLLLGRYSMTDTAAVVISTPACSSELKCATSTASPARARLRNLAAGSYRLLAESALGLPMKLTALVRPAVPATIVPFANHCGDVLTIPSTGGFFQGTTVNAQPDFDAGCDQGAQPPGGAPDQILKLTLTAPKRVVLDMQGSAYSTLLDVRQGSSCPGSEVEFGCAAGYYPERSFLDLELAAGTYYIQIDGFAGQSGPWFLDVFVVDP